MEHDRTGKESVLSLTQEACERLRDAIVSGRFEFGERLSEEQIARALGMSKAPVRAAFMDLRDMGLVTIVPSMPLEQRFLWMKLVMSVFAIAHSTSCPPSPD